MNKPKSQQVLALQIIYFDSIDRNLIQAYVYREEAGLIAYCAAEDIRIHLQNLIHMAPHKEGDNDLGILQSIASHLADAVNRYARREYSIIPRSDVKSYE